MAARSLVIGGTGRLGAAVAQRFRERGDDVFVTGRAFNALPEAINYLVFCQRYRGPEDPAGEWRASVELTNAVMSTVGFADDGPCAVVMVSSITGLEADAEHPFWYQCAKAAQLHLGRHWAKRLRLDVHVVCPRAFTGPKRVVSIDAVADEIVGLCNGA